MQVRSTGHGHVRFLDRGRRAVGLSIRPGRGVGTGFTLIEVLVVAAILLVLMSIICASLLKVRGSARSFVCKNKLKTVAFEFIQFADGYCRPWRGQSDRSNQRGFDIDDFQERLYAVAEFWGPGPVAQSGANVPPVAVDYQPSEQPLICPAGPQQLGRRPMLALRDDPEQAVVPLANVSMGFNMRLGQVTVPVNGQPVLRKVRLTRRILQRPSVPLAFDVDGVEAEQRSVLPYYSAPPAGSAGGYADGTFWFPSYRHGGSLNAAFVGGHVLSSARPERQAGWDWKYEHPIQ